MSALPTDLNCLCSRFGPLGGRTFRSDIKCAVIRICSAGLLRPALAIFPNLSSASPAWDVPEFSPGRSPGKPRKKSPQVLEGRLILLQPRRPRECHPACPELRGKRSRGTCFSLLGGFTHRLASIGLQLVLTNEGPLKKASALADVIPNPPHFGGARNLLFSIGLAPRLLRPASTPDANSAPPKSTTSKVTGDTL